MHSLLTASTATYSIQVQLSYTQDMMSQCLAVGLESKAFRHATGKKASQ
ncbi:MAG: hypothetical protein IJS28_11695 [Synergistaceae bacterium]|nr:hypothetical protein [Synergistaceae bacterium]